MRTPAAQIAQLPTRQARMDAFIQMLWPRVRDSGVSWVGFYVDQPGQPDDQRLILAAREPRPACSPIGLHGACGKCLLAAEPLVVPDIRALGASYIACDPRDLSELVVPCCDPDGAAWGVLDFDSHEISSFDAGDAAHTVYLLRIAGLSA